MNYKYIFIIVALISTNAFALDAQEDGDWISLGQPSRFHLGANGYFFLNGTNQGSCSGKIPTYFRVNMDAPHFNEFYSWVLYMAAQKNGMDCMVKSGCGISEVWVEYCRGSVE